MRPTLTAGFFHSENTALAFVHFVDWTLKGSTLSFTRLFQSSLAEAASGTCSGSFCAGHSFAHSLMQSGSSGLMQCMWDSILADQTFCKPLDSGAG